MNSSVLLLILFICISVCAYFSMHEKLKNVNRKACVQLAFKTEKYYCHCLKKNVTCDFENGSVAKIV